MSYAAIEVELRDGCVVPRGSDPLPSEGAGLLVILSSRAGDDGGWQNALEGIRRRQAARRHVPRPADAVAQQIGDEREAWD